jgi:hypothetical protein
MAAAQFRISAQGAPAVNFQVSPRGDLAELPTEGVIVGNVAPGRQLRLFVTNTEDAGADVPEDLAGAIFDKIATPQVREIEGASRAASFDESGAV